MTKKAEFNAEEWETVTKGPPIAGLMVVAAERGGTIRESLQIARAYEEGRKALTGSELVDELLESAPSIDPSGYASPEDLRKRGLEDLRAAVGTLDGKASEDEIESYRGFVLGIAERVAHAHKTGGFLGFGGREVSENEEAALADIRQALGAHEVPDPE